MNEFKLGEHEQAIQQLLDSQVRLEGWVLEIREALAEKKGERRVALWAAGVAGSVAAALVSIVVELVKWIKHT